MKIDTKCVAVLTHIHGVVPGARSGVPKRVVDNQKLFEMWFQKILDVTHLKNFGSLCDVHSNRSSLYYCTSLHTSSSQVSQKLGPTASHWASIGYTRIKIIYRLMDSEKRRILNSAPLTFTENAIELFYTSLWRLGIQYEKKNAFLIRLTGFSSNMAWIGMWQFNAGKKRFLRPATSEILAAEYLEEMNCTPTLRVLYRKALQASQIRVIIYATQMLYSKDSEVQLSRTSLYSQKKLTNLSIWSVLNKQKFCSLLR